MPENNNQSNKKVYRIVQIEGKITWQVEELWDGGVTRGPYGSKDAAINSEKIFAEQGGFLDDLELAEVVGEEVEPSRAFEKDEEGTWLCVEACSIGIENKEIVFTKGLTFTKGNPFMGVDVAKWLEENIEK
ncbi:hypothetical protein ACFLW0_05505 [Chloroflexota bacterium]